MDQQQTLAELNAEKRARIVTALKADPTRSDRIIAAETKTSQPTTYRVRKELEASGAIPFIEFSNRTRQDGRDRGTERNLAKMRTDIAAILIADATKTDISISNQLQCHRETVRGVRKALELIGTIRKISVENRIGEHGIKPTGGARIQPPDGMSLSDFIQTGFEIEENEHLPMEEVSKRLGVCTNTYTCAKGIIKLHQTEGLAKEDKELVNYHFDLMNKTLLVGPHWKPLRKIAEKVWGSNKDGRVIRGDKRKKRKIAVFDHALILIGDTCARAEEVEVPVLTDAERVAAYDQLGNAIRSVKILKDKLRRGR